MKTLREQTGSTMVMGVLLAALVLAAAGLAVYTFTRNNSAPAPSASATPVQHTSAQALTRVKAFYTAYIKVSSKAAATNLINQYATSAVLASYNNTTDMDAITCSQNPLSSVSYGTPTVSGKQAMVTLVPSVGGSVVQNSMIQVTVRLSDLKITQVICEH